MKSQNLSITLNSRYIFSIVIALVIAQVIIDIVVMLNWHLGGIRNDITALPVAFFDLSTDTSIPTWFSSVQLLLCSLFLFLIYKFKVKDKDRFRVHWLGLSIIFLIFSIDEVATIHEKLGERLADRFLGDTSGLLHYGWVVFGGLFVAVVALLYVKFIQHLPDKSKFMFILSIAVFLIGALGIEMFSGNYSETHGSWNLGYALWTAAEEFFEMAGISLFLLTIIEYIRTYLGDIKISIGS